MVKVLLYFVDFETRAKLPPEEWEVDESDEFDIFVFNAFLAKIGVRSTKPFMRDKTKVLLTHIIKEFARGAPKVIFVNAENI